MSTWQKRDIPANCFLLSHEVFELGLTRGVLLVYLYLIYHKYLKRSADRLSYAAISKSAGLCVKTVRTHLHTLVTRELIEMEGDGGKFSYTLCPIWDRVRERRTCNGNLLYTITPIDQVLKEREKELLGQLKLAEAQRKWDERVKRMTARQTAHTEKTTTPNQ